MAPARQRMLRIATRLAWAVAALVFVVRGPIRATRSDFNDLISPYAQASAWVHGADPYSPQSLARFWPKSALASRPELRQFEDGSVLVRHGLPTAYPPTCLLLLAPFTFLPWHTFRLLYILSTVVLLFVAVFCLVAMAGLTAWRKSAFVILTLLFSPFHSGIATCNLAIVAIALGVVAGWVESTGRKVTSGVLIAICVGLKPQIGLCFLGYYVLRRQWRVVGSALAVLLTISMLSVLWLSLTHTPWVNNYGLDNHALFQAGVLGDSTERNPTRFGLVNLQVAIYPLLGDKTTTEIFVLAFVATLIAVWGVLAAKLRNEDELLCLSALCALSLLPVYHRFYDAALLLIPLAWICARPMIDKVFVLGMIASSAFLLPGGSLLETLRGQGTFPAFLVQSALWNTLVMAHAVWCIVVLSCLLLFCMANLRAASSEIHPDPCRA